MSEQKTDQVTPPAAVVVEPPKPKLAAGLFQPFTLGSTLEQGQSGNVMSNMKPNMMDYEKKYQGSTKNQELSAEELAKLAEGEVKKGNFKEVSGAIQRKEGVSKERADAIAAAAGRKELGEKEMERRSKAGKDKAKKSMDEELLEVPTEQREAVMAEFDRRIDEAKKSNNEGEVQKLEKAKEKAKKCYGPQMDHKQPKIEKSEMEAFYSDAETLQKALFNEAKSVGLEKYEPSKKDLLNQLCYKIDEMKRLKEASWLIEGEIPEVKNLAEKKFSDLKRDIQDIQKQYKSASSK